MKVTAPRLSTPVGSNAAEHAGASDAFDIDVRTASEARELELVLHVCARWPI